MVLNLIVIRQNIVTIYSSINRPMNLLFPKKIKPLFLSILIFSANLSKGQVHFEKCPMENQLIQRNDNNIGNIQLKGFRTDESFQQITAFVYKNGGFYTSQKKSFETNAFEINLEIRAEMSEYDLKIFAYKNRDSILVKEIKHLLCGENILVYGQSNALAVNIDEINRFDFTNNFARTTIEFVDLGEYKWYPLDRWNGWSAGMLGLEIQRNLINQFNIPVGIINGSLGNMSIVDLTKAIEGNHADKSTIYGRFLSKAQNLGAAESARILVWRQGEKEAFDENYKNDYEPSYMEIFLLFARFIPIKITFITVHKIMPEIFGIFKELFIANTRIVRSSLP